MKCPKCDLEMEVQHQDISSNPHTDTFYDRIYYVCRTDDIWVTTETPREPE